MLDADPRVIKQIDFTGNLECNNDNDKTKMILVLEEVKK